MEQVRGQVGLLALLLLVALAFDPLIYFAMWGDRDDRRGYGPKTGLGSGGPSTQLARA